MARSEVTADGRAYLGITLFTENNLYNNLTFMNPCIVIQPWK